MNASPEVFKKQHLEQILDQILNLNTKQQYSEIVQMMKTGKINFMKNEKSSSKSSKLERSKLNNLLNLKSKNYQINLDVENNLIVLLDKEKEDEKQIIFVELTHQGLNSLNLYSTLIKNLDPDYILIDQEPYYNNFSNISDEIIDNKSNNNSKSQQIQKHVFFNDIKKFKDLLRDNFTSINSKNYLTFKGPLAFNLKDKSYLEVESLINIALTDNKMVELIDLDYKEYIKSFLYYDNFINKHQTFKFEHLEILNVLEISSWLSLQESIGCKKCASFFNKKSIDLEPLNIEYLFDKKQLPNYEYIISKKVNRITEIINKNNKVMIFGSDILNLFKNFLNKEDIVNNSNNNNMHLKLEEEINSFNNINEANHNIKFKNTEILNGDYLNKLTQALLTKEYSKKFINFPPFEIKEDVHEYRKTMIKNINKLYGLDFNEINTFIENEFNNYDKDTSNCEPLNYIKYLNNFKNII